jgi:hypothetical protein
MFHKFRAFFPGHGVLDVLPDSIHLPVSISNITEGGGFVSDDMIFYANSFLINSLVYSAFLGFCVVS